MYIIYDIVIDGIIRQTVNALDIKMADASPPDLNFAEDTHVEISCNRKNLYISNLLYMNQQPEYVFRSTKTKPSVVQRSIPKT